MSYIPDIFDETIRKASEIAGIKVKRLKINKVKTSKDTQGELTSLPVNFPSSSFNLDSGFNCLWYGSIVDSYGKEINIEGAVDWPSLIDIRHYRQAWSFEYSEDDIDESWPPDEVLCKVKLDAWPLYFTHGGDVVCWLPDGKIWVISEVMSYSKYNPVTLLAHDLQEFITRWGERLYQEPYGVGWHIKVGDSSNLFDLRDRWLVNKLA